MDDKIVLIWLIFLTIMILANAKDTYNIMKYLGIIKWEKDE